MRVPPFSIIAIYLFLAATVQAEIPKKRPLIEYEELWLNSPITSDPIIETVTAPPPNPLEDYTLASICMVDAGWHVILLHKKDRNQRIRLTPSGSSEMGYKVISVEAPLSRQARVQIATGGEQGWVTFEKKFLALRRANPKPISHTWKGLQGKNKPPIPGQQPPRIRKIPVPRK